MVSGHVYQLSLSCTCSDAWLTTCVLVMQGGKMKTSIVNEQHFPAYLKDVQVDYPSFEMTYPRDAEMTCPSEANSTCTDYSDNGTYTGADAYYALGSMRFNTHIGHLVWSTMFLRLHNSVCDMLAKQDPTITDEAVRRSP